MPELIAYELQPERATASIARQIEHADNAVFHKRAGGDAGARCFDERVGAIRTQVRVIKQRDPDIDVEQASRRRKITRIRLANLRRDRGRLW